MNAALVASAFSMGLFGSTHCAVMCGGAVSALCGRRSGASFQIGRVVGYSLFGLLAGAVGSWTVGHGLDPVRFAFRLLATLTLLGVGLQLVGLPSFIRYFETLGAPLWRRITRRLLRFHASAVGALWALMPCGLLYAALALAASSYSALDGAATMAAFALGTLPLMLGFGAAARRVSGRTAGVAMLAFGLWSIVGLAGQAGIFPLAAACHDFGSRPAAFTP